MRRAVAALVLVALIAGCATGSWQDQAKRSVLISVQAYDATMTLLGRLHAAGEVSEAEKDQIVRAANVYRSAALLALQAAEIGDAVEFGRQQDAMEAAQNDLKTELQDGGK